MPASPPYHLRTNKSASRLVFISALRRVETCLKLNFEDYTYCGLGGPYLEDFRLMHHEWPGMPQISFENTPRVYKRQKFHRFSRPLRLRPCYFDAQSLKPDRKYIVWLDFTTFTRDDIDLFSQVLQRVGVDCIVKITVPLHWRRVPDHPQLFQRELPRDEPARSQRIGDEDAYIRSFRDHFGSTNVPGLDRESFFKVEFPKLVMKIFQLVAQQSVDSGGNARFAPFFSSRYEDTTGMLSLGGIMLPKQGGKIGDLKASFRAWDLGFHSWNRTILNIRLPDLSSKERMKLDEFLPQLTLSGSDLVKVLGYHLDDNVPKSRKLLQNYGRLHQHSPLFLRVHH
jgi:hypothetical protein